MSARKKTNGKLRVGFLMDPIEKVNLETDTTMVLMMEAQRRNHQVLYFTPQDLYVREGRPAARMRSARVRYPRSPRSSHYTLGEEEDSQLSTLHILFNRVDPPYTIEYVTMTQTLGLIPPPTAVINRPSGVLSANEKILAMRFPQLMPRTLVSHRPELLLDFLERLGGEMVVKPLSYYGGIGVFLVEKTHTNARVILETATGGWTVPVVAQERLPVEKDGDKRIILLGGEPIGAMLRMPPKGDHRANLHSGGSSKKAAITDRDREICRAIAPWLRRQGLYLAGIDVISGLLTEINVTSPTLVKQINELDGVAIERRIMDFCQYLHRTSKEITDKT